MKWAISKVQIIPEVFQIKLRILIRKLQGKTKPEFIFRKKKGIFRFFLEKECVKGLRYRGADQYNKVNINIRQSDTISAFKTAYMKDYFNNF